LAIGARVEAGDLADAKSLVSGGGFWHGQSFRTTPGAG
jgi:hypothetical protein